MRQQILSGETPSNTWTNVHLPDHMFTCSWSVECAPEVDGGVANVQEKQGAKVATNIDLRILRWLFWSRKFLLSILCFLYQCLYQLDDEFEKQEKGILKLLLYM